METRPPRPEYAPSSVSRVGAVQQGSLPPIAVLDPAALVALLAAATRVVLLVGTSSPRSFLPGVARRYAAGPGPAVGLGYYKLNGPPDGAWLAPLVESVLPRGAREVARGYYLFQRARALSYHPGLYHPRLDAAMQRVERALGNMHSTPQATAVARRQLDLLAQEAGHMVVEHFDEALGGRSGTSVGEDPYAVLGLSAGATAGEIRAAYYARMREVHPDRVATLAAAEQDQAHQQAQAIIRAYQSLRSLGRGTES